MLKLWDQLRALLENSTCSLTNCAGTEKPEDNTAQPGSCLDGNRKHYPIEGEFSGQPCSSPLLLLDVGAGAQKRFLCSCQAVTCLKIELKYYLLAACNRHWGLDAGNRCGEEEEGCAKGTQRVPGWEKRKAGAIRRKQALQDQDEFMSHCLFSTQLVPAVQWECNFRGTAIGSSRGHEATWLLPTLWWKTAVSAPCQAGPCLVLLGRVG